MALYPQVDPPRGLPLWAYRMGGQLAAYGIPFSVWEFDDSLGAEDYVEQWKASCAHTHLRNQWTWQIGSALPSIRIDDVDVLAGTHEHRPSMRAYLYAVQYPNGSRDISFLCVKHSAPKRKGFNKHA